MTSDAIRRILLWNVWFWVSFLIIGFAWWGAETMAYGYSQSSWVDTLAGIYVAKNFTDWIIERRYRI